MDLGSVVIAETVLSLVLLALVLFSWHASWHISKSNRAPTSVPLMEDSEENEGSVPLQYRV